MNDTVRHINYIVILAIILPLLYYTKPSANIRPTVMVLPQVKLSDTTATSADKVIVYHQISNYWAKEAMAIISIKYPVTSSTFEANQQASALAKQEAAKVGANAIVIANSNPSQWFATNQKVLNYLAIAYKI